MKNYLDYLDINPEISRMDNNGHLEYHVTLNNENFILNYKVNKDIIKVYYASNDVIEVPYSKEAEIRILYQLKEQLEVCYQEIKDDEGYITNNKIKLKYMITLITNILVSSSIVIYSASFLHKLLTNNESIKDTLLIYIIMAIQIVIWYMNKHNVIGVMDDLEKNKLFFDYQIEFDNYYNNQNKNAYKEINSSSLNKVKKMVDFFNK